MPTLYYHIIHSYLHFFCVVVSKDFFWYMVQSNTNNFWPIDGTLSVQVRVDLGVMAMKRYSLISRLLVITIILLCHQHGYPWLCLTTPPYWQFCVVHKILYVFVGFWISSLFSCLSNNKDFSSIVIFYFLEKAMSSDQILTSGAWIIK